MGAANHLTKSRIESDSRLPFSWQMQCDPLTKSKEYSDGYGVHLLHTRELLIKMDNLTNQTPDEWLLSARACKALGAIVGVNKPVLIAAKIDL